MFNIINITPVLPEHREYLNTQYTTNRWYHGLNHLQKLYFDFLSKNQNISLNVLLKIAYHDCVYVANSSTNEKDSADVLLYHSKELNFPDSIIENCCSFINMTSNHIRHLTDSSISFEDRLLLECDLLGLGNSYEEFLQNASFITKEYLLYYTLEQILQGRKEFFKNIISVKKPIFSIFPEQNELVKYNINRWFKENENIC